MTDNGVVTAGGRLTAWVALGVLGAFRPPGAVDDAVAAAGRQARRSDGKLPPHVMVYFVMALALFDDDYEEVAARLTETLTAWGCWDDSWSVPTSVSRDPPAAPGVRLSPHRALRVPYPDVSRLARPAAS